jgi:hypothetical protein
MPQIARLHAPKCLKLLAYRISDLRCSVDVVFFILLCVRRVMLVVVYRGFGNAYRPNREGSSRQSSILLGSAVWNAGSLKSVCPETFVNNYRFTLPNNPGDRKAQNLYWLTMRNEFYLSYSRQIAKQIRLRPLS